MVNTRPIFLAPIHWLMGLALALATGLVEAAPIRVTTWDLRPGAPAGTNAWTKEFQHGLIKDAAQRLKSLRPDVILLQEVSSWETCRQLAQALQPEIYHVAICSTFRDPTGKPLSGQVAIISKAKASLAWSTPWRNDAASSALPGGYAFAALHLGDKNVGVFSVQLGEGDSVSADGSQSGQSQAARAESALQLLQQIASLQSWQDNRPETFVVAGDFNTTRDDLRLAHEKTLSLLEQAGFEDAFAGLPLEKRITRPGDALRPAATLDYIFTRNAGLVAPGKTTASPLWQHAAVTCEMDFANPKPAAQVPPPAPVVVKTPPTPPPPAAPKPTPTPTLVVASNTPTASVATVASNAAAAPPPSMVSNTAAPPSPLATKVEAPPSKPAAKTTNLPSHPAPLATAATPVVGNQALVWLAAFLAACLVLFLVARKILRQSETAPIPATASDLQRSLAAGLSVTQDDSILVGPPPSPPYVSVEMEGSMQTQSQTWPPRPADERLTARLPEQVQAGVIANLSRWLKQKAVQRLVSDRARLLATQQAAGLAVLAVDQRLAKIEDQIQRINHDYERRIDELLKELIAAKEENRELIRAKIALVKSEMEKARLRAAQPAREPQQY